MNKDSTVHVGIGFATGRKNFLKVLKTYIYNWKDSGLTNTDRIALHVFIAYDLQYNDTKESDFTRISTTLKKMVDEIVFVDASYIHDQTKEMQQAHVMEEKEAALFFTSGYAAMRNAVLYAAVKEGMDYLLFLDDDEYPLAVTRAHDVALWSGQKVLASHLCHIPDADITNGYHCGYVSPIPYISFNETLTEQDFRLFIEAISNDIINWDNIARVMRQGGVTYADTAILTKNEPVEVPQIQGCKFISGSNLCLNLKDPTRSIPFYNPPGARGEDTFLSTCLGERKVVRIPTYAFHNGFSIYNDLLSGVLPTELKPIIADSKAVILRFLNACNGWVRYKPLLLYITHREDYPERIAVMKRNLSVTLPKMAEYFHQKDFLKIMGELDRYSQNVEAHYAQFMENQRIWQKIVKHLLQSKQT